MSQVRFQVLFGPASVRPWRVDWPSTVEIGAETTVATTEARGALLAEPVPIASGGGEWYGWRLMGANNRELGRSAVRFVTYQGTRRAIVQLKRGVAREPALGLDQKGGGGRLRQHSTTDPATGRWGWRVDLDGVAVAVNGRWYERDHDSRLGVAKFVSLTVEAALADGVVTLYDTRGLGIVRMKAGGTR